MIGATLSISELKDDLPNFKEFVYYNAQIRDISPYDNVEKQFSKGLERLKSWLLLYNHSVCWHPYTNKINQYNPYFANLETNQKIFCLSVLIILFQVFGDGNHRTAYYFYERKTGVPLSDELKIKINKFHSFNEFSMINLNQEFIEKILSISHIK
ncbi:MAG: hypothetical protein WD512_01640 [Candidatus Paceibacterota bacterium]